MHGRAHAAEALCKEPRISRIAPTQNLLDAAPHGARSPCIADDIVVDLNVDAEVSFNSSDRINGDALCHRNLLLFGIWKLFVFAEMPVLEIPGPTNVRTTEPEVTRHVMPLAQWRGQDGQPLHRDKKAQHSQRDEAERYEYFGGGGEIQGFRIGAERQRCRAEAIDHSASRTQDVAHKHRLRSFALH